MGQKAILIVMIVGIVVAAAAGIYGKRKFEQFLISTSVVTASVDIPAYTVISPSLLTMREVPRSFLREPIAREPSQVIGKVTLAPIKRNSLIYLSQLISMKDWRLTDNPFLEVVSFSVSPERAVGGRISRGSRINIYRIATAKPELKGEENPEGSAAEALLELQGAAVELLAEDVPVVDIRTGKGTQAGEVVVEESGGPLDGGGKRKTTIPPQILTVAVKPDVAKKIIQLQGEEGAGYQLWVTLPPVKKEVVAKEPIKAPEEPTPTPESIPTVQAVEYLFARVTASALNVRKGPGKEHTVVETVHQGDLLTVLAKAEEGKWLMVETPTGSHGWVQREYVEIGASELVTPSPTPTNTPTPTPTQSPTPTPVPEPSPTPTTIPLTPVLLSLISPSDGACIPGDREPILRWQGRALAADEAYVVELIRRDKELGPYPEYMKTRETSVAVPLWIQQRLDGSRLCEWSVRIYRAPVLNHGDKGDRIMGGEPVGEPSERWSFTWAPPEEKPKPTPEEKPRPPL